MHGGWCSHRGGPLCGVHSAVHTIHSAVHTIHGFHREGFTERGFTRVSKFGHPNFGFWAAALQLPRVTTSADSLSAPPFCTLASWGPPRCVHSPVFGFSSCVS